MKRNCADAAHAIIRTSGAEADFEGRSLVGQETWKEEREQQKSYKTEQKWQEKHEKTVENQSCSSKTLEMSK